MKTSEVFTAEYKVIQLAKFFKIEFNRYSWNFPDVNNPKFKENKYWDFFSRCVDYYSNREEWNAKLFVESLFAKYGKIYPYVLTKRQSWYDYLDYKNSRVEEETVQDVLNLMLTDFKKMKKLMEERNLKEYSDFFYDDYCAEMRKRNSFDGLLFHFMRSYSSLTEENFTTNDKIVLRKMIVCRNVTALRKLKKLFKDELYLDDVREYIKKAGS